MALNSTHFSITIEELMVESENIPATLTDQKTYHNTRLFEQCLV